MRNSEVEKKRAALEKRLTKVKCWGEKARLASARASKTADRRWKKAKARSREAYTELNKRLFELEAEGVPEREYRARTKKLVAAAEEEMEGHRQSYYRAHARNSREYERWQRYCREQCDLLRGIEDLKAGERQMYELDDSKDQLTTVLKLALANLGMWARDNYFPPEYARATWSRLAPFFRLPGRVVRGPDAVRVEPRGFNDRGLNRDLVGVRARVAEAQPRLPGGRRLHLTVPGGYPAAVGASSTRVA